MGDVYLCEDLLLKEKVALKVLKKEALTKASYVDRFVSEVKIARSITHKNVVRTYDLGWHEGYLYFTMEYVEGLSLREFLSKVSKIPVDFALKILIDIAQGLAEIHKNGIIHRDLKPSNVILKEDLSVCKISDFGIANSFASFEQNHGEILGSVGYIAPEIWKQAPFDEKSDLYSFGVLAFQLLTGRYPFEGESSTELFNKINSVEPPDVDALNAEVPSDLSLLVKSLLNRDPGRRPESAEVVVKMLTNIKNSRMESKSHSMKVTFDDPFPNKKSPKVRQRKTSLKPSIILGREKWHSNTAEDHEIKSETSDNLYLSPIKVALFGLTLIIGLLLTLKVINAGLINIAVKATVLLTLVITPHICLSNSSINTALKRLTAVLFFCWFVVTGALFYLANALSLSLRFFQSLEYLTMTKVIEILTFDLSSRVFLFDISNRVFIYSGVEKFSFANSIACYLYLIFLFLNLKSPKTMIFSATTVFLAVLGMNALVDFLGHIDQTSSIIAYTTNLKLLSGVSVWLILIWLNFQAKENIAKTSMVGDALRW